MRRLIRSALLAATAAASTSLAAQPPNAAGDSGGRTPREPPMRPAKPLQFTTDEGTWLSLDLSPDGKTIVFDLLGDLYTLPLAGGKATRITSGQALDAQPHWSPDGKSVVFVSDRAGSDNLWIADADGSHARAHARREPHLHLADVDARREVRRRVAERRRRRIQSLPLSQGRRGRRATGTRTRTWSTTRR